MACGWIRARLPNWPTLTCPFSCRMDRKEAWRLHVMSGTPDEIKARLLGSIDAFFEIYADL